MPHGLAAERESGGSSITETHEPPLLPGHMGRFGSVPLGCCNHVLASHKMCCISVLYLYLTRVETPLTAQQLALGCLVQFAQARGCAPGQCLINRPLQGHVVEKHCLAASRSRISAFLLSYLRDLVICFTGASCNVCGSTIQTHTLCSASSLKACG